MSHVTTVLHWINCHCILYSHAII